MKVSTMFGAKGLAAGPAVVCFTAVTQRSPPPEPSYLLAMPTGPSGTLRRHLPYAGSSDGWFDLLRLEHRI